MISFNFSKSNPTKSADEAFMNLFNTNESKKSTKYQKSAESAAPMNSCRNRVVQKVTVKAKCDYSITSPISTTARSNYEEMTRPSTVRNRLISLPFNIKNKEDYSENEIIATIKIQSIFRKYLVIRKYYIYEKQREANRNLIIEDAIKQLNYNIVTNIQKKQLILLDKNVKLLIEELKYTSISKEAESKILQILFFCISKDGTVTVNELILLLCDVLKIPYKKSEFFDVYSKDKKIKSFDRISYHVFLKLFTSYKNMHGFKKKNCFANIIDSFTGNDIPESFLLKFYSYQIVMYDVIFSINKYDRINPKLFQCYKCSFHSVTPSEYIHHKIKLHHH